MGLMLRLVRSPRAIFISSCIAGSSTLIAILAFGVPPIAFVYVTWGGSILLGALNSLANRRLGPRRPPPVG